MPADWIISHDPKRFGLLREITRYHGAYSSAKAKHDVPEFAQRAIDFRRGAAATLEDMKRRGAWPNSDDEKMTDAMIAKAQSAGVGPVVLV
jgi:hypothetical protein